MLIKIEWIAAKHVHCDCLLSLIDWVDALHSVELVDAFKLFARTLLPTENLKLRTGVCLGSELAPGAAERSRNSKYSDSLSNFEGLI